MSDEVVKEEGTAMYVHEVKYDTLTEILKKVTDVNKVFTYSMPNKAESYANNGFDLISVLNEYINGDESWRISKETNVKLKSEGNKIQIGDWIIQGSNYILCIPRINSIIIIPDENCTYKGTKDVTKIIQLTNCISVTPLLVRLLDEPTEEENQFRLGMTFEIIVPKQANEKTAQ